MSDRALSDVVGYVLIFALVLLTATAAVVLGTSALTDVRDVERANNVEAAFDILAENVEDHATERATGRATEIKVSDGELYYGDWEEVYVNVTPPSANTTPYSAYTKPVVYESEGGSKVVYSNGALFRENEGSSIMIRKPRFRFDNDSLVLAQTTIDGDDRVSVKGSQTVLIRTELDERWAVQNTSRDEYEVTVAIVTEPVRSDAWLNHLKSYDVHEENKCAEEEVLNEKTLVECTYSVEEVYISVADSDGEFT